MISDERGSPARGESDLEIELAAHAEAQRVEEPETSDGEERRRELIAGDWEDDYQGRRQLTLRPDGTATMIVEPSGPGRRIFAARLQFEIEWTLHEGRLTMTTTDGEPKSKTQLIRRIFGDRAAYEVLALDGEQMLLRDVGDEAEYDWRRVRAAD